jgi:NADH-quinone oxidoreductase subunit N
LNTLTDRLDQLLGSITFALPELWLAILFFLLIIIDLFSKKAYLKYIFALGLVIEFCLIYLSPIRSNLFLASFSVTELSNIFKYIFAGVALFTIFILHAGERKNTPNSIHQIGELYAILIVILLGMNVLAMSENLLVMYIALEIVSIGGYILTVLQFDKKGLEVGMKYIVFGIFSSAIMLYGISLLYGFSGSLHLQSIAQSTENIPTFAFLTAFLMAMAGFLFKISASPFHLWTPDVYEGAPTSMVAFFSTASKAAGFAILIKFVFVFKDNILITNSLIIIAIASISVGNFSALWQNSFKRLLAYSGIAQAGFMLVGLVTKSMEGVNILMFYLVTYIIANLIAFLSLALVEKESTGNQSDIKNSFSGLGNASLLLGIALSVSMISLVGLPLTAGFTAKLLIFTQLWQIRENTLMLALLVIGLLTTVLSLYFYLKIPYFLFFKKKEEGKIFQISFFQRIVLGILAFILLFLFLKPEILFSLFHNL